MKLQKNNKIFVIFPFVFFLLFILIPAPEGIAALVIKGFILMLPVAGLYFAIKNLRTSESAAMSFVIICLISLYSLLEAFVIYIEVAKFLGPA
jgi:hypothetical protein